MPTVEFRGSAERGLEEVSRLQIILELGSVAAGYVMVWGCAC